MSVTSTQLYAIQSSLTTLAGQLGTVEQTSGDLVTDAGTHIGTVATLWTGETPAAIDAGAADYVAAVQPAAGAIGSARALVEALATTAGEIAGQLASAEAVVSRVDAMSPVGAQAPTDEDLAARSSASGQIATAREAWATRCRSLGAGWTSTIDQLVGVVDAMALESLGDLVPTHDEYLRTVVIFAATTTFTLDDLDPSGEAQQRAQQLHDLLAGSGEAAYLALLAAVLDVGKQGDIGKLDGNWSTEDLEWATDAERVAAILAQLNEEHDLGLTDADIAMFTDQMTMSAWLLRADEANDWEQLDHDSDGDSWVDWLRKNVAGPVAGIAAGTGCMLLIGPESGFTATGACVVAGGSVWRGVDTWANGGDLGDVVSAAADPRGIAIDLATAVGTAGLASVWRIGRNWWVGRVPATRFEHISIGRPVWTSEIPPTSRGYIIEDALGGNLTHGFPVVDYFDNGLVVSIKSIDIHAPTYQNPTALTNRLHSQIDSVAGFQGARRGTDRILAEDITERALTVAIPPGATPSQLATLQEAISYGESHGVFVNVVVAG